MSYTICYVTAFIDIGRDEWTNQFKRSHTDYFQSFEPYINLFNKQNKHKMLVYIDSKYHDFLQQFLTDRNSKNIELICISREQLSSSMFVNNPPPMWYRFNREKEIMESSDYKNRFRDRLCFPENHNPAYTLINHSKIDFIINALTKSSAEYFCWVDFGYFKLPEYMCDRLLDINKLNRNKINYTLINPLNENDKNIMYTMHNAPERIGGFFFFGPRSLLKTYQILYHSVHLYFQNQGLCDDDQHIALRCYYKNPELFELHYPPGGGWHRALQYFQQELSTCGTC